VLLVSLGSTRELAFEGSENWGFMPTPLTSDSSRDDPTELGRIAASISAAVVHVFSERTGRRPTRARTTIDGKTVVVVLQDSMTRAERSLAQAGEAEVLQLRRTFQETMSDDLVTVVERLTRSTVRAFMSANHAPDAAAETFLMDRTVGAAADRRPTEPL
jgi:uncharacterized protein YbcI